SLEIQRHPAPNQPPIPAPRRFHHAVLQRLRRHIPPPLFLRLHLPPPTLVRLLTVAQVLLPVLLGFTSLPLFHSFTLLLPNSLTLELPTSSPPPNPGIE